MRRMAPTSRKAEATMSRGRSVVVTCASVIGFALLAGWSVHRDSPQGLALGAAAAQPCGEMTHGFAAVYMALVGVGAGVGVVMALALLIVSQLGLFGRSRGSLSRMATTAGIIAVVLVLALAAKVPIERALPLQPVAGCEAGARQGA
jgi:hypothetical protein